MLRLRLLGGVALESNGEPLDTERHRRALIVLAVVAIAADAGMSRDKLLAYFWPDSDADRARNALRQRIFALRRELGVDDLFAGTTELRLNPQVIVTDVAELDGALATGDAERTAELYNGSLLDGVHIKEAPELERWIDTQRDRLAGRVKTVLAAAGAAATERGDHRAAARWWRMVVTMEPASSDATRALIAALGNAGEVASALRHFHVFESLIRSEYGVEPDVRVVALVERLRKSQPPPAAVSTEPSARASATDASVRPRELPASVPPLRWKTIPIAAAGIFMVIAAGIAAARASRRAPYDDRRVVVAAFENRTGDASLDPLGFLAADWIAQGLQGTRLMTVVDPATAMLASNYMRAERARGGETSEVRLMADETRAGLVVTGSYYRAGDSLVMVARVSDARREKLIDAIAPERFAAASPASVLDRVRQRVLGVLAFSLDTTLESIVPAGSTTLPTYDAYREYMEGMSLFQKRDYEAAGPRLARAYALDTTFTHVLIWYAWAVSNGPQRRLAQYDSIVELLTRSENRLAPLDRAALDYLRASRQRDRRAMLAAATAAARLAPGSHWSYNAASNLSELGRFEEAVRAFDEIDPGKGWTRGWMAYWDRFSTALHFAHNYRRELDLAREARRVFPSDPWPVYWEARALAAMRRVDEMNRVIAELRASPLTLNKPFGFVSLLSELGWELELKGDSASANRVYDDAIAWFRALPPEQAAVPRHELARLLYRADRLVEAQALYQQTLASESDRPRRAPTELGCILARLGHRERAEQILADVLADTTNGVGEQTFGWSARIAACLGDRDRAVEFIRRQNLRHRNRPYLLYVKGFGLFPQHTELDHKDFDTLLDYPPYQAVRLLKR